MKTLKQLWEENGCKPFWAQGNPGVYFYAQAFSLDQADFMGSSLSGRACEKSACVNGWQLCNDPRPKPKKRMFKFEWLTTHGWFGYFMAEDESAARIKLREFGYLFKEVRKAPDCPNGIEVDDDR